MKDSKLLLFVILGAIFWFNAAMIICGIGKIKFPAIISDCFVRFSKKISFSLLAFGLITSFKNSFGFNFSIISVHSPTIFSSSKPEKYLTFIAWATASAVE
jgi:hypothetical protein